MAQLLLELFSEEIPARMQADAARALERMAREALAEAGLLPEALKTFAGPRRLTLVAEGLPEAQGDRSEERKGPRVGAPDQAMDGFLRSTGLTREQLTERDGVWFAVIERKGRPTAEIVAAMVDKIVRNFPWPKSMISGTSRLRWVRPLKRILCVFDREIVPFDIEGIASGDISEGHRFMGNARPFRARDFDEYREALAGHYVVLDVEERKERILEGARTLCFARNLELVEDQGLLDEVAGLAEWPTPILGDMDPVFLDLPPEVIRTSMRTHQKYFAVRDPASGKLAPHFLVVANLEAVDGGKEIARGNAKVLSARLSDARFFWDEDRKIGLADRLEKLKGVTFHAKLGTMYERVERIEALAREVGPLVGADAELAAKAAKLAKADLGTNMVGEFPELQGLMGGYYARAESLGDDLADAIRDHYRPQGPADALPATPLATAVALADKLDTLTGFFGIEEKPTGSRDPFALRRAALGVIRIILEKKLRLGLIGVLWPATNKALQATSSVAINQGIELETRAYVKAQGSSAAAELLLEAIGDAAAKHMSLEKTEPVVVELREFFADRLKVLLRDQGKRHDLVDAVFALGDDDLVRIVARVEALEAFLASEDGSNLLAGFKRAANILKAEEKKGPLPTGPAVKLPSAPAEEIALIDSLTVVTVRLKLAMPGEDFEAAMGALATLRAPVDAFFDKVLVNSEIKAERDNRLRLLIQVRDAMSAVADFSLVTG
ncbi:glycyl-tRNA synthetase beta chain [Caulobacter ginsengisoli]|uniref:Glycine--tRNA ligase beta subunit n=1 Tax=Caulobacter ginsengisoli TaxID=400775 RepID=A0ABU0IPH2_9CAUL|nr:glycine--tRNA ligase subunit beta [Caulobacter ginsengisoli]MDQ0463902.1 glycyl-tRNA synthetase beta chain [Caulobacter ginsengisoli]